MIELLSILVFGTQLCAGWSVWRRIGGDDTGALGTFARALVLGPAAISLQMLGYAMVGIPFGLWPVLAPWLLLAAWDFVRFRPMCSTPARTDLIAFGILALPVLFVLTVASSTPIEASDAMNNHALPARMLAAHGGDLTALHELIDPGNVHYPPLLAFNEALFFLIHAKVGAWLVQPFFALGFLAWCLLVYEAIARQGSTIGLLLFALVVWTPEPMANATFGLGDVRLMAALLLVVLETKRYLTASGTLWPVVAGAVAMALTKREGLVAAGAVCGFLLILHYGMRRGDAPVPQRPAWIASLAILILASVWPVVVAVHGLAALPAEVEPEITFGSAVDAITRLPETLLAGLQGYVANGFGETTRWALFWPVALLAAAWSAWRMHNAFVLVLLWFLHFVGVAYVLALLGASFDVPSEWIWRSTLERLQLPQMVWGVALFGAFADD